MLFSTSKTGSLIATGVLSVRTCSGSAARAGAEGSEHLWLVARQDVDYVAQIEHRLEPYAVRIAPVRLGTSSLALAAEIVDGDAVLARGRTVLVCADKDFRPSPLTEETRAALGLYIVENGG